MANYIMTKDPDKIWLYSTERKQFGYVGILYLISNPTIAEYLKFGSTRKELDDRLNEYRRGSYKQKPHLQYFEPTLLWHLSVKDVGRANVAIKYFLDEKYQKLDEGNDWYKVTLEQFLKDRNIQKKLKEYI